MLACLVFFTSAVSIEKSNVFSVFPNEVKETFVVNYTLEETTNVRIVIAETNGTELKELVDDIQSAGDHHLLLNTDLPAGLYQINVTILDKTTIQSLTIR